jgi:hypothetical protein
MITRTRDKPLKLCLTDGLTTMHINNLERANTLRDYRHRVIQLRDAAKTGAFQEIKIWHEGASHAVWPVISVDPVRAAIVAECDRVIAEQDALLAEMGVKVGP